MGAVASQVSQQGTHALPAIAFIQALPDLPSYAGLQHLACVPQVPQQGGVALDCLNPGLMAGGGLLSRCGAMSKRPGPLHPPCGTGTVKVTSYSIA